MNVRQLEQLKDQRPALADRVDIRGVKLDPDLPAPQRAEQYLRQVQNPYYFRCGDIAVNVEFAPGGRPLKEHISSYLKAQKNAI